MSKTTVIKCSSRASVKIKDNFYTIEYGEERTLDPEDNIEEERKMLWDDCNGEVDTQVEEILRQFK